MTNALNESEHSPAPDKHLIAGVWVCQGIFFQACPVRHYSKMLSGFILSLDVSGLKGRRDSEMGMTSPHWWQWHLCRTLTDSTSLTTLLCCCSRESSRAAGKWLCSVTWNVNTQSRAGRTAFWSNAINSSLLFAFRLSSPNKMLPAPLVLGRGN